MVKLAIKQLWDAAGRLGAWARANPWPYVFLAAGLAAFLRVLVQTIRADNMGFQSKTFWDWMGLLLVPAVLALAGLWFSRVQKATEMEIARQENDADREIARDRQRQNTLDSYLDKMTELILEKGLGPDAESEVKRLARTRTIIALISLDSARNRQVIQFLHESDLLQPVPVVNLRRAFLSEANLRGVYLSRADLAHARLDKANLTEASLTEANLTRAILRKADLSDAHMKRANLSGADFSEADVIGANLTEANLVEAHFHQTNLSGAYLAGADLTRAGLRQADLRLAHLTGASLNGADLAEADLTLARVTIDQLLQAQSLLRATMPDGTKYEEWIKRQKTAGSDDGT